MKIFPQIDKNDCGISLLQSIIYDRFKVIIPRKDLYKDTNITTEGVDILSLEHTAKKYGIILNSYWLEYDELLSLESEDFFVTIINLTGQSHYVLVKKHTRHLTIYDSIRGKIHVPYEEFRSSFLNIYIEIKYDRNIKKLHINSPKIKNSCLLIDWQKSGAIFFLKFMSFAFLTTNFYLNKVWVFDAIQNKDSSSVGYLCFFGILFFVNWAITDYIQPILALKHKKTYLKDLYQNLFNNIENKKNYFYQKFGKHNFMYLYQHILNIATFRSDNFPDFLLNSCLIVFLLGYLHFINPGLIFVVLISFSAQSALSWLLSNVRKKYFPNLIQSANSQKKLFFHLDSFLKKEWNSTKLKEINFNLKNEINKEIDLEESMSKKSIFFEKINDFVLNITTLCCYMLSVFMNHDKGYGIENIILSTIVIFYLNKSFRKLIDTQFFYDYYQKSLEVYKNWFFIENIDEQKKINWNLPQEIEIKNLNYYNGKNWVFKNLNLKIYANTFIFGQSGAGKSTIYKFISNKIFSPEKSVFFNGIGQDEFNQKDFNDHVIYQINEGYIKTLDWDEIFERLNHSEIESVKEILNNLSIDITNELDMNKLSSGQKQAINIINLLKCSKKILLLDESLSQINKENKVLMLQNIFPILQKNNFVVCSEHDLSISNYFENHINLNEHISNNTPENTSENIENISTDSDFKNLQEVEIFEE